MASVPFSHSSASPEKGEEIRYLTELYLFGNLQLSTPTLYEYISSDNENRDHNEKEIMEYVLKYIMTFIMETYCDCDEYLKQKNKEPNKRTDLKGRVKAFAYMRPPSDTEPTRVTFFCTLAQTARKPPMWKVTACKGCEQYSTNRIVLDKESPENDNKLVIIEGGDVYAAWKEEGQKDAIIRQTGKAEDISFEGIETDIQVIKPLHTSPQIQS